MMTLLARLTDRPQTKRQIAGCACLGDSCVHKRDIEEEIRRLTLAGNLIVSDGRGYRLTDDLEDVERYIRSLEGRRDSLTERVQALRRAVEARRRPVEQIDMGLAA